MCAPFIWFVQEMFPSDEAAYEEVKRGRAWGSIVFTSNFTKALSNRVDYGTNVDNFSLDASEVEIRLDMSSKSLEIYDDSFENINGNNNFLFSPSPLHFRRSTSWPIAVP